MFFSPGGAEDYFRDVTAARTSGESEHRFAELAHHHGIDLLDAY